MLSEIEVGQQYYSSKQYQERSQWLKETPTTDENEFYKWVFDHKYIPALVEEDTIMYWWNSMEIHECVCNMIDARSVLKRGVTIHPNNLHGYEVRNIYKFLTQQK